MYNASDFSNNAVPHVVSFSYIKDISHLFKHLEYVGREEATCYTYNAEPERIKNFFDFAYQRKQKRKDARIALKFYLALPKVWYGSSFLKYKAESLADFISKALNVKKDDIMLFFHHPPRKENGNFHVHVVVKYQTTDGKSLRIQPQDLRRFHASWDEFLAERTYEPFKLKDYYDELTKSDIKALVFPKSIYDDDKAFPEAKQARREVANMAKKLREIQIEETLRHMEVLHNKEDTIWIMAKKGEDIKHRRMKAKEIRVYMSFLRYLNAQGYDIYVSMNSFKHDSKERKAEQTEELQNKIWLDIDGDKLGRNGLEILKQILQETKLPKPTILIRTSKHNYQAVWKTQEKVNFNKLRELMQELERRYNLDHTSDPARVLRLAGFNNKKRGSELCIIYKEFSSFISYSYEELAEKVRQGIKQEKKQQEKEVKQEKQDDIPTVAEAKPLERAVLSAPEPKAPTPKLTEPKPKLSYAELLEDYAREKIGISISLRNVGRNRPVSLSELDWAFARELLKAGLERQEVIVHLTRIIQKLRPEKIEKSPNYVSITVREAWLSLIKQQQEQQQQEQEQEQKPPDEDNFYFLRGP